MTIISTLVLDLLFTTFRSVAMICDLLTFPIYAMWQRGGHERRTSQPLGPVELVERSSESVCYRRLKGHSPMYERIVVKAGVDTLSKAFEWAVEEYGDRPCLGTRGCCGESRELQSDGKSLQKLSLSTYSWLSYNEVELLVRHFGRGLRLLGFKEKEELRVAMFAETRMEWLVSSMACFSNDITVCTVYTNLGVEAVVHALMETRAATVITSHELLPKLLPLLPSHVRHVVYFEDAYRAKQSFEMPEKVSLNTFDEVVDTGRKTESLEPWTPSPESTAVIMYTSGSTGTPKGVELTHSNLVSTMTCLMFMLEPHQSDLYIAFLPLAHVLELLSENTMMLFGVRVGYSSPHTMTDMSSKIGRGCEGDATLIRPTLMCAVPLILDRIVKNVKESIERRGPIFVKVFNLCYEYKLKWLKKGLETPLLDLVVFNKIKRSLGGRMRMVLSGGAPLSAETHDFIRTCFGPLVVVQGYSLTESCCTGTVMQNNDLDNGHVGQPMTNLKVKLVNWNEGGYTVNDKPLPRGEVLLSGPPLSKGYFSLSSLTSSSFFTDGKNERWFRTGDIGSFDSAGRLTIIDRKKDLVKLQLGEYVSLGKVEALLKTHPLIDHVCVYADPSKRCTVALVVPNALHLCTLAREQLRKVCWPDKDISDVCDDQEVVSAVLKELRQLALNNGLQRFEMPQAIRLVPDQWTPESGLITAAFKLKRAVVQRCYKQDITKMYADMA